MRLPTPTTLTLPLLALLSLTTAQPTTTTTHSLTPHPEGPIFWRGPLSPGGANITLNGTHHDIAAKLLELQPYWMRNASVLSEHAAALRKENQEEVEVRGLEKRGGRVWYGCNNGYDDASLDAINAGWRYIFAHYGMGECGTGPYSCGRFSCSYDAAILLCNSANDWTWTPCPILSMNAEFIANTCGSPGQGEVQGQAFYVAPNYNVLIKETDPGKGC